MNKSKHILKLSIYLLVIFTGQLIFAQVKDTRAELEMDGNMHELSISPDGRIWLVSFTGKVYYADNVNANWHQREIAFKDGNTSVLDGSQLERISFFNKDAAIMTGYIPSDGKKINRDGYYQTKDGGMTWKLLSFGTSSWIYDACVDTMGNAWMGGSSGEIFYSKDFGTHFEKLNSPFNGSTRMHTIFMRDATTGVAGALFNAIYITNNNWKTSKKIATPLDQKKYVGDGEDRIEKLVLWQSYIVVKQLSHVYYSELNNIDWKSFPVKIRDLPLTLFPNNFLQ